MGRARRRGAALTLRELAAERARGALLVYANEAAGGRGRRSAGGAEGKASRDPGRIFE